MVHDVALVSVSMFYHRNCAFTLKQLEVDSGIVSGTVRKSERFYHYFGRTHCGIIRICSQIYDRSINNNEDEVEIALS